MKVINPYNGVNFSNIKKVRGVTHEHIYRKSQADLCFQRGIRIFANVNYQPSVPSVNKTQKMSSWEGSFKDWKQVYTDEFLIQNGVVEAVSLKPDFTKTDYFVDVTYSGSIPSVSKADGSLVNTDLIPQIANAERVEKPLSWATSYHHLNHHNFLGSVWSDVGVRAEIGNSGTTDMSFRRNYSLYSVQEEYNIVRQTQNHQFNGKLFGTINHPYYATYNGYNFTIAYNDALNLAQFTDVFHAVELYNMGYSPNTQKLFRQIYNRLLNDGFKLYVSAVVDWQDSNETYNGLLPEEKEHFEDANDYNRQCEQGEFHKESNYMRGCNVLLFDNSYGDDIAESSAEATEKAELALEAYIQGRYYASGFGDHCIEALNVESDVINFSVGVSDDISDKILIEVKEGPANVWNTIYTNVGKITPSSVASKIVVVTNLGETVFQNTNNVSFKVSGKVKWLRFEAYYEDADFIFTNPIWIDNDNADLQLFALE